MDVTDDGVLHEFSGYPKTTSAAQAIEDLDWDAAVAETGSVYWVCTLCNPPRSTSDPHQEHMSIKHPTVIESDPRKSGPPVLTTKEFALQSAQSKGGDSAATISLFTLETPLYRLSNAAAREFGRHPEKFDVWKKFARRLNDELLLLPKFSGMVYRAIDFKPPSSSFAVGSVVTWNQPSSTSKSAKVVKEFLSNTSSSLPFGTIYTIVSKTGRRIEHLSVFAEEEEVLMPCGSQFRVVARAQLGIKRLLEEAMESDLRAVDVIALEELELGAYETLLLVLTPEERQRNFTLCAFIATAISNHEDFLNTRSLAKNIVLQGTTALHLASRLSLSGRWRGFCGFFGWL